MTKIFGASLSCVRCGAQAWPCCSEVREDFDVRRYDAAGRPAETPSPESWSYCREHAPPKGKPKEK
jgi:hypothetical protein